MGWPRSHSLPQPRTAGGLRSAPWAAHPSPAGAHPSPAAAVPAWKGPAHPGGVGWGGAGQKRGGRTGRAGRPFARTHSSLSRTTSVLSLSWQGGCEARHGRGGRGGVWSPWLPCGEDPQGGPRARLAGKGAVAARDSRRPLPCQSRQQGLQSDPTSVFTPSSTP